MRRLLFFFFSSRRRHTRSVSAFLLNRSSDLGHVFCKLFNWRRLRTRRPKLGSTLPVGSVRIKCRSEERFSRNAETDLVCRLLLEKKKNKTTGTVHQRKHLGLILSGVVLPLAQR